MPRSENDITFEADSMYGSVDWVALRLGRRNSWFYDNRQKLFAQGFPQPDPVVGLFIKGDVEAWVNQRRRIADRTETVQADPRTSQEVNFDAL